MTAVRPGLRAAPPAPILAVGVLVPARDERDHVTACLHAVLTSLAALPPHVATALCLVVDRSRDGTGPAARRAVATHGGRAVVDIVGNEAPMAIGAVRNLGARALLRHLARAPAHRTLLLSTDADSTVPADWARAHLRLVDGGADAVSGGVELDGPGVLDHWPSPGDAATTTSGVPAYAANLGVRASSFLGVGGFPAVVSGEEHALLDRLGRAGHRTSTGAAVTVRTSARTTGRAAGGLADLLARRAAEVPAGRDAATLAER